jgi:Protein of unknown function (DUF3224)
VTKPTTRFTAFFEILAWDETYSASPVEGWSVTRATVRKRFTGDLEGTSIGEVTTSGQADARTYLAAERVEGSLAGRTGSFLLVHGGIGDATEQHAFGHVVAGSGAGELVGVRGEAVFAHDETGARLTLTCVL